jgi:hypothetical protein
MLQQVHKLPPHYDGHFQHLPSRSAQVQCAASFYYYIKLSLIYSYVAVYGFCAVRCLIVICFYLLFYNY